MFDENDERIYRVVRNGEEQYSIWPADRSVPAGWDGLDMTGTSARCLEYIGEVWTDMRPKSLRERAAR
jgi:MbtH protein